jgi:hypothetical protein
MPKRNLNIQDIILANPFKTAWLHANRGLCVTVAAQLHPPVSQQFVRMVYYGHRRSKRVERALGKFRAPGFERYWPPVKIQRHRA